MSSAIFISHSSRDSDFVDRLRQSLDAKGYYHLFASRELRSCEESIDAIYHKIETAHAFIVVVSPDAFNSAWVAEETRYAAQVKEQREDDYPVVPLLREGVELGALKWLFIENPLAIRVGKGAAGVKKAMPMILRALGA